MRDKMMRIRRASHADVPAIRACAEASYEKYVGRMGEIPAPMLADFEMLVSEGFVYVANDEGGVLAGFIVFYPRGDHMHLENVAVSPDHQGQGVGGELIAFCEEQAHSNGCAAVELYTNEKMSENLTLYPKLGYVETGRGTQHGFHRVFFRKEI